jgi:hypothetical protein
MRGAVVTRAHRILRIPVNLRGPSNHSSDFGNFSLRAGRQTGDASRETPREPEGQAPTWNQMGSGNWSSDPDYASEVINLYDRMRAGAGLSGV